MVERFSDNIMFSPEEMAEFNVPKAVTAKDAVFTAVALRRASQNLSARCDAENGDPTLGVQQIIQSRRIRATRLAVFSTKIFDHCTDEHLEYILDHPDEKI